VRNVLIQNFNPIQLRNDIGQLWENYLMVERRKSNQYTERRVNSYFWRTYDQKEIDYIEEGGGQINGFEFKWKGEMKASTRSEFIRSYPNAQLFTITQQNFIEFLK
jgi:predicted AAA+ superfamily ATPase